MDPFHIKKKSRHAHAHIHVQYLSLGNVGVEQGKHGDRTARGHHHRDRSGADDVTINHTTVGDGDGLRVLPPSSGYQRRDEDDEK